MFTTYFYKLNRLLGIIVTQKNLTDLRGGNNSFSELNKGGISLF
jgi:hypothetical protein